MTDQKSAKRAISNRRKRTSSELQGGVDPGRTRLKKEPSSGECNADFSLGGQDPSEESDENALMERGESDRDDPDFEETPCRRKSKRWSSVTKGKPVKSRNQEAEKKSRSCKYQAEKKRLWRMQQPYLNCPDCDYRTKDKETYGSHIAKHNPSVERFLCEDCAKTFRNKRSFRCHLRSHGSPEQLHQCAHCEFRTPSKINWVQHLAVKHKVDATGNPLTAAHACTECGYTCMAEYQLKAHFSRKHQPDKAYKCEQCPYSSHIRFEVEKHMKIKHLNIRNYVCDRCGKTSQTKSGLERHKQTHTPGLKPYKCTMCDAAYADNRKLKSHLARHENNEKPFRCPLCTHSCYRRDNLQMHIKRIHKTTFACLMADSQITELAESPAPIQASSLPESAIAVGNCCGSQQSSSNAQVVEAGGESLFGKEENSIPLDILNSGNHKTTSEFIKHDVECEVGMEKKNVIAHRTM